YGGALTSVNAVNCTFKSNYGSQDTSIGGAMYEGTATNCIFTGNYVKQYGGAMYNATAINCTFTGNAANRIGGAMDYGTATNCTFIDNTASLGQSMMQGTAINCTFVNNNIYQSLIKFYITNEQPEAGNNISFTGLPECNLIVNVTNKDGESKTFDCTNEGWNMGSLEPGTYTIRFTIKDDKSNSGEFETQITVPDVLGLNVNVEDIFEGQNATVNINANDNFTDNVTLSVNGKDYTVEVINGVGNYSISGLPIGNHTVTVSFKGGDNVNPSEKSVSFEVKPKYDLNLNVNANDINEGNMATVTVTTNDAFDGMVKISINGTDIQNETLEIIGGKGSFIAMDLPAENYTVTVCFDGNIAFNAETKSVGFEVKKEADKTDLDLTVSVEDIFAGQNATVKVTTNNTFNGNLILIINGIVSDNIIINNGEGSYAVEKLSVGNYTAYVGFNGDDTFDSDAKSKSFEVKPKIDLDLNVNASDIFEGQDAVVNITSINTFTGNVTLSVNGADYTVEVINGIGNHAISGLPAGNHTVTVSFKGSDEFNSAEKSVSFEVKPKYGLDLNVNASDIFEGQDAVVNITTDSNFTGEVILSINGQNITVNVVNGVCNYALQELPANNYTATVSFKGNDEFNPTEKSAKFEVKPKYDLNMDVNANDINEGNMATVTVTANDAFEGMVKISINGTDIQNETIEIIGGKGSFIAMDLPAEDYAVTVCFDGNIAFNAETKSAEFKVIKEADKTDLNLTVSVEDIFVGQYACVNVSTE
ncbi:MAG: Ig-like domain-containing protein, partial [Methanobrevibacter sp.]|nr:Ig-like domain-containing protein [Methanobrevibacter sp.]